MLTLQPVYAVVYIPEIYLVPSAVSPDLKWNATTWVKNIPSFNATFAYQIELFFNTSVFECVRAWIPEWDEVWIFAGSITVAPSPTVDNASGFAAVGDSILIGASVSGSGPFSLAVFEFRIKSELDGDPLSYVDLNNPDTCLLNDAVEEISPIIKTDSFPNYIDSRLTTNQHETTDSAYMEFDTNFGSKEKVRGFAPEGEGSIELIVGLDQKISNSFAGIESLAAEYGGYVADTVLMKGKNVAAVVNITLEQTNLFVSEVEIAGLSTYVEPRYKAKALMVPNDPLWTYQWGPKRIQADWAWNTTIGNDTVLVAVVDSGIDYNHPDLAVNYVPLGYDWANNDTMDDLGHGSHVAGIIAAKLNNSLGIAGLAQVRIMAEKVLSRDGYGENDWIANGIIHATE